MTDHKLTDAEIDAKAVGCFHGPAPFGKPWIDREREFARVIEAAAQAPLLAKVAELEAALAEARVDAREWLHGWPRMGETGVLMGTQVCCVGCGKGHGITTVALEPGDKFPDRSPDWPFKEESCPVCALQSRVFDAPEDKLTARLKALRTPTQRTEGGAS